MVSGKLVDFLKDVNANPAMLTAWSDDRDAVIEKVGLSEEDALLLRGRDEIGLRSLLAAIKETPAL